MTVLAVSDFWGGDGDTWRAILAIVVMVVLSARASTRTRAP
jgi:hypothetical protein